MSLRTRLLGEEGARSPLALALVEAGARVGVSPYNWRTLRTVRHFRAQGASPKPAWDVRAPTEVTRADEALCERLIAAYAAAQGGRPSEAHTAGLWSWIFETRQRPLADILDRGDAFALATELASMFQKLFVLGMNSGSMIRHSESRLGCRIWQLRTLDGLVSLAEALGVVAVEDPAQGAATRAFDNGLSDLVLRIEQRLGISIDFPNVGAAYGLTVHKRLVTMEMPEQIYVAVRLIQALDAHLEAPAANSPSIVEIGAGYGEMCYWFLRLNTAATRYVVIDLPIANVLQGYFLSRALGPSEVSLFGEKPAKVIVAPNSALSTIDAPYDVLVNKYSMPEMPEDTMLEYLRWAHSTCTGIFFSCNLESTRVLHGEKQGSVPEAVEQAGGFSRLRRDESWIRRGCVEEIYEITARDRLATV